jgi:hypothetical protein
MLHGINQCLAHLMVKAISINMQMHRLFTEFYVSREWKGKLGRF